MSDLFKRVLKIFCSALAIYYLLSKADELSIRSEDIQAIYLGLAFVCQMAFVLVGAQRLFLLQKLHEVRNSFKVTLKAQGIGIFSTFFLPGMLGQALGQVPYLSKNTETKKILKVIAVDRLAGIFILLMLAGFKVNDVIEINHEYHQILATSVFGVGAFIVLVFLMYQKLSFWGLLKVLCCSIAIHVMASLSFYFIGLGLSIDVDLMDIVMILPIVRLLTMIPISYGGIGLRDASFSYLILDGDHASALKICTLYIIFYWSFCFLAWIPEDV